MAADVPAQTQSNPVRDLSESLQALRIVDPVAHEAVRVFLLTIAQVRAKAIESGLGQEPSFSFDAIAQQCLSVLSKDAQAAVEAQATMLLGMLAAIEDDDDLEEEPDGSASLWPQ